MIAFIEPDYLKPVMRKRPAVKIILMFHVSITLNESASIARSNVKTVEDRFKLALQSRRNQIQKSVSEHLKR